MSKGKNEYVNNIRFLNFPIELVHGLLDPDQTKRVFNDIVVWGVIQRCLTSNDEHFVKLITDNNLVEKGTFEELKTYFNNVLHPKTKNTKVVTGVNLSIVSDLVNKSEYEKYELVCFLAFVSIKSFLLKGGAKKLTKIAILSRMDGHCRNVSESELSPLIAAFGSDRKFDNIKKRLLNWNVKFYSRYMRGMWISIEMSQEQLIFYAESRRLSNKDKEYRNREKQIVLQVKESISKGIDQNKDFDSNTISKADHKFDTVNKGEFYNFLQGLDYSDWKNENCQYNFMKPISEYCNKNYGKMVKWSKCQDAVTKAMEGDYIIHNPKYHWSRMFNYIIQMQLESNK